MKTKLSLPDAAQDNPPPRRPPTDKRPAPKDKAVLISELAKSTDTDLPVDQRPTRADKSDLRGIAKGDSIRFGDTTVEVLGPGRGVGWLYVGWFDEVPCLGQVHVDQIEEGG